MWLKLYTAFSLQPGRFQSQQRGEMFRLALDFLSVFQPRDDASAGIHGQDPAGVDFADSLLEVITNVQEHQNPF